MQLYERLRMVRETLFRLNASANTPHFMENTTKPYPSRASRQALFLANIWNRTCLQLKIKPALDLAPNYRNQTFQVALASVEYQFPDKAEPRDDA